MKRWGLALGALLLGVVASQFADEFAEPQSGPVFADEVVGKVQRLGDEGVEWVEEVADEVEEIVQRPVVEPFSVTGKRPLRQQMRQVYDAMMLDEAIDHSLTPRHLLRYVEKCLNPDGFELVEEEEQAIKDAVDELMRREGLNVEADTPLYHGYLSRGGPFAVISGVNQRLNTAREARRRLAVKDTAAEHEAKVEAKAEAARAARRAASEASEAEAAKGLAPGERPDNTFADARTGNGDPKAHVAAEEKQQKAAVEEEEQKAAV
jgi:hypothetical protein